jgi:spermidine synthase
MPYTMLTFIGCAVLLCVPVICMGATLPILCRFYVTRLSHLGTNTGRLYGLNTIGAALGALVCGFWLINLLGVWGTLILAVLINTLIGILCIFASRRVEKPSVRSNAAAVNMENVSQSGSEHSGPQKHPGAVIGALVIFAVSGFCSMAYEVIWAKLLGLIVGPTTYSFTIVLVTFILGLALGSMIFGWLGDRTGKSLWILMITQVLAALSALGISQIMGNSQFLFAKLIFHYQEPFALLSISKAAVLFLFMIIPTLCLGATFPLVGKIYTRSISGVGRSIGFAYAINTVGAVLGAFCAGFVLIPLVGKENGLSLVVALQLITTLLIASIILLKDRRGLLKLIPLAGPALAGLILCFYLPQWDRHSLSLGKYHRFSDIKTELRDRDWKEALLHGPDILAGSDSGELVFYGDGIGGFTTVLKYPNPISEDSYLLAISGKPDASTQADLSTQTISAHFPMLFHRDPKKVMVLGLASGITAGEVLYYPVEQLDVIDISEQVVSASDFFIPWNNNVLSDPRTNLIIQDGRAHLNLTRQSYDVIISEPSNPWMAGLASLFTHDFFTLARDRLAEDGIFLQFMHSYQMDWPTFALVGRSFVKVFPNSLMLVTAPSTHGSDFLLVGFKGSKGLNTAYAEQKISYTGRSKNISLSDPRLLYRLIVSEDLERLFGPGPINTDRRPLLEFSAPKLMHHENPEIIRYLQSKKRLSPESEDIFQQVSTDIDAQIDFAAFALSVYAPFQNMVDLSKATFAQKRRVFDLLYQYYSKHEIDDSILNNVDLMRRCRLAQVETIHKKIDLFTDKSFAYAYQGYLYYELGMMDRSLTSYSKALDIDPDNPVKHNNIGLVIAKRGNLDRAVKHFNKAIKIDPGYAKAHNSLGYALIGQYRLDEAIESLKEALRIDPDLADANRNLEYALGLKERIEGPVIGDDQSGQQKLESPGVYYERGIALARQGRHKEAITALKNALQIKPDWAEPMNNLAWILASSGEKGLRKPHEALMLAEKACELTNHNRPDMLDTLAVAYAANERFSEAVETAEKVLKLIRSPGQTQIIEDIQDRLRLFKEGKQYRESTSLSE